MHFMIRIKCQKQESLKEQNQDYKENIIDDIYHRWYDTLHNGNEGPKARNFERAESAS